jgi:hypothetical protein
MHIQFLESVYTDKPSQIENMHPVLSTTYNNSQNSAAYSDPQSTAVAVNQWLNMSRKELDTIFKDAKPGTVPQGDTQGTAILAGGPVPGLFAKLARLLFWRGKVFDLNSPAFNSGVVVNKVSPLGINLIVAKVYIAPSWIDGKDCIVIDYNKTSILARQIRDEIREIEPGLYLGKVWWGKRRILDFALESQHSTSL